MPNAQRHKALLYTSLCPIPLQEEVRSPKCPEGHADDKIFSLDLGAFDFARFFTLFPLDSPVSKFFESFPLSSLQNIMVQTATQPSPSLQFRARCELERMLADLHSVLRVMDQAHLAVRDLKNTVARIMIENRRAMEQADLPPSTRFPAIISDRATGRYPPSSRGYSTRTANPDRNDDGNSLSYLERYPSRHRRTLSVTSRSKLSDEHGCHDSESWSSSWSQVWP